MTPAATREGRAGTSRQSTAGSGRASAATAEPGHRRNVSRRSAPNVPRRVSGPIRGRLPGTPAPEVPAPRPRRGREARVTAPLGARLVAFVRGLPDHPLLDRLIRGRAWIPLLGVLLAGIVAMQVEVLKLNASIGRSIEHATALQNQGEQLRMTVAALDADQRIERLAAAKGMIMAAPAAVAFLTAQPASSSTVRSAIANIHAPDAPAFLSLISSNGAIATSPGSPATAPTAGGSTATGTPSATGAPTAADAPTATGTPSATGATSATGAVSAQPGASAQSPVGG